MQTPDLSTFPLLIRVTHFVNIFCILLLMRSGLQILADHPKLYWTDHTSDENHWIRFGKKQMPKDKLWTSLDEAETISAVALPGGHHNLGAGRNWHFVIALLWIVTGVTYVGFLFATGHWQRLIPTDPHIIGKSLETLKTYLSFHRPPETDFNPYDPLQQLAYAGVVFILSPLMMLTALAMSPAFIGRFPGYLKLFGGQRQVARSLHFIGFVGFIIFVLIHILLVCLIYFPRNIKDITLGSASANLNLALGIAFAALLFLALFNIWATMYTQRYQRRVQVFLAGITTPIISTLFGNLTSRQRYTEKDISPFFRVNGYPPKTEEFQQFQQDEFRTWRLAVGGLVENPLSLSLSDLQAFAKQEQITKHNCIQGWSAVGQWGGVPLSFLIEKCKPSPEARYVAFTAMDSDDQGRTYYEVLQIRDALDPQTILAYEMNGKPLPLEHGAPLRLRCERKLGYKMVKYLKSVDFIHDYKGLGEGKGGYREDTQFFDGMASI